MAVVVVVVRLRTGEVAGWRDGNGSALLPLRLAAGGARGGEGDERRFCGGGVS